jgi:hypothetical protein
MLSAARNFAPLEVITTGLMMGLLMLLAMNWRGTTVRQIGRHGNIDWKP